MLSQTPEAGVDVTVIGGGLAGKAASLHLAKAGLTVICIEPKAVIAKPSASHWTGRRPSC